MDVCRKNTCFEVFVDDDKDLNWNLSVSEAIELTTFNCFMKIYSPAHMVYKMSPDYEMSVDLWSDTIDMV